MYYLFVPGEFLECELVGSLKSGMSIFSTEEPRKIKNNLGNVDANCGASEDSTEAVGPNC